MNIPESTDDATFLRAEIDELKRRLAALEAGPAVTEQTFAAKVRRRLAPRKIALLITAVILVWATIVFGQSAGRRNIHQPRRQSGDRHEHAQRQA
jgi:hypothetical protein